MERQAELVVLDELVTVEPGQIAQTSIRLRNTSDRVVHYSLRPAPSGQAASWLRIVPDSLQLLEGDDGQAEVFVQPPPGAQSAAGRLPFAVIADPGPDSGLLPTVAEADVAVGAVHALDGRLIPTRVRGRFQGKIRADFNNLGNEVVRIFVSGSDDADNEVLHFATADGRVAVPAGGSSGAFMKVRPDKPIVIGKPVDHPFVVTYARRSARSAQLENQESADVTASLNGVFTQKPIISKWMMVVAALLLALAAIVFLVNRATAADPVPAAPVVPVLTAKNADAGVLNLVFNVSDNPERVEVELIEPPADGNFDLATAIAGTQVQSENSGSSRPVVVPLPESAEETDVFFRYRSVDADERPSIWNGESVFRSSSIEFESPVIQNVAWLDASQISVVWSTPPNPDDVTLAYRLRNADTSVPIDNAEIVSGNTNNAIVPVDGAPFAIEVQVFNADDESQQSNWSEPMAPTGERPAVSTLPAPTIVRAEWFDHESVLVEWTSVGTGSTLTFELTDENGNRVTNAEQLTPTSVRIPMPAPTLFGVRVRALDETTGDRSPLSPAFVPDANARPSPPTIPTTTPPTTTPPTTVPTTTAPVLPKPQGFWILPQGANEPTNSTRVIWEMALGRRLKQFEVAGSDLSDLTQNLEAPLSPSSSVWVSDGYATQAEAVADCQRFVQQLVDDLSGLIVGPSDCWVVGPETTDFVKVPPPPPGDALTTP